MSRGDAASLRKLIDAALDILHRPDHEDRGPVPPGGPAGVRRFAAAQLDGPLLPARGVGAEQSLPRLGEAYARGAVDVGHPAAVARMQCPPAEVAVAADLLTSALNQSMHAWEAGPFALELERSVIGELVRLIGYGPDAGGTITAGGTVSNIMAVLIARDEAYRIRLGESALRRGVAGAGLRPVILCTETAHFSVERGARIAGLGTEDIIRVPVDRHGCMIPDEADRLLSELPDDRLPIMLFACAGTTDFGRVDPLTRLAGVARRHGVWFHADAAYGGGALFSGRLRRLLDGISAAHSITLDLHKFGWTPASSGVLLARDAAHLDHLAAEEAGLNAPEDVAEGFVGRYATSIQGTRRCDALKIAATFLAYGRDGLGAMVDACHDLALHGAGRVRREEKLELAGEPVLTSVVFRYVPRAGIDADAFNGELRRLLMKCGRAVLARVCHDRGVFLKAMLLNPETRPEDLDQVFDGLLAAGAELELAWRDGATEED